MVSLADPDSGPVRPACDTPLRRVGFGILEPSGGAVRLITMLLDFTPHDCRRRVPRLIDQAVREEDSRKRHALLTLADQCIELLRARRAPRIKEPRSFAPD